MVKNGVVGRCRSCAQRDVSKIDAPHSVTESLRWSLAEHGLSPTPPNPVWAAILFRYYHIKGTKDRDILSTLVAYNFVQCRITFQIARSDFYPISTSL